VPQQHRDLVHVHVVSLYRTLQWSLRLECELQCLDWAKHVRPHFELPHSCATSFDDASTVHTVPDPRVMCNRLPVELDQRRLV